MAESSDLTLLALFSVLVGDDPVRRVAARDGGAWAVLGFEQGWRTYFENQVHDVRPLEVVVLPEVGKVVVSPFGSVYVGPHRTANADDNFDFLVQQASDHLARLRKAAAFVAARATEPTPDLLAPESVRDEVAAVLKRAGLWPSLAETYADALGDRGLLADPLAQARERLGGIAADPSSLDADDAREIAADLAVLLAATEGGAS
jgi:hypothetical protein